MKIDNMELNVNSLISEGREYHDVKNLKNISLVCIETRFVELALFAIKKSTQNLAFDEIILFSDKKFDVPDEVTNIIIPPINSTQEYSEFIVKKLPDYITTDFILIIQWDGFVINHNLWNDDFLKYDYIGAPWGDRPVKVGNGGFSLRSKKILLAAQTIVSDNYHPEDRVICETYQKYLEESFGVVFAPEDLALVFSFEDVYVDHETFGFHALYNIAKILNGDELINYISILPKNILQTRLSRRLIKKLYQERLYKESLYMIKRSIFKSLKSFFKCSVLSVQCAAHFLWHRFIISKL